MREQDLAQTEALKMNHLSVEEVAERRAELAKMRDLMFRAEAKAKRIAKIKSKTYRRIRKKEREKLAKHLGEMDEDEVDEEVRMRREANRAKERATLRHKNTGKWAKAMKSRGELDEDQRRDINEMLDRGDKLRRRIHGQGSGSDDKSEDEDEDHDSDMDGGGDLSRIKAHAFDELEKLNAEAGYDSAATPKGKSVFEMKFMRTAMAREQQRADQMAEDLIREMGEDNAAMDEETTNTQDASWQRTGGRVSFRPGNLVRPDCCFYPLLRSYPPLKTIQPRALPSFSMASDTSSVTLKSTDLLPDTPVDQSSTTSPVVGRSAANLATNPWLVTTTDAPQKVVQKRHEVSLSKESGSSEKSKNKLRKRVRKREEEKEKAKEDATVDISMSDVMTLGVKPPSGRTQKHADDTQGLSQGDNPQDDDSDAHSEIEVQEQALTLKATGRSKDVKAFEQRDLVARAFAGDNVVRVRPNISILAIFVY